ncbi:hypothetical protein [Pseudomonas mangiferae]|uniref:hypothetical protein n=1 Tax=Pseudomonas mangiferae TaxID=2593654 RepID=UPI0015B3D81C|nr:hypothetical protein [Pseudomonas mangiferae]
MNPKDPSAHGLTPQDQDEHRSEPDNAADVPDPSLEDEPSAPPNAGESPLG